MTGERKADDRIIRLAAIRAKDRADPPVVQPDPDADGAALLDDVYAFLRRFVAYPSLHACAAHALWVAHTHLMDVWESTPRIAFLSAVRGSGKTRALEISALLVPRPVLVVNCSAAYVFRKVADPDGMPTILYDECDAVFSKSNPGTEDVRGFLNAGHRKGAVAGRCVVRGRTVETEEFPAYCAVGLAGIGRLPDTILSRCVIVRMRKRAAGEPVEPYRPRLHDREGHALRDRLAAWAAGIAGRIVLPEEMPASIQDRDADIWEPLLAVADAASGEWPDKARAAGETGVTVKNSMGETALGPQLLADIRAVFSSKETLSTKTILHLLQSLPESSWDDIRGKPLTAKGLGLLLSEFEIYPDKIDRDTRGYFRKSFADAWQRYCPPVP